MFKVLIVAYYFPPMGLSGVQRTLKFVKYLGSFNWQPTVLTTSNVAYFAHDEQLKNELDKIGVEVIRVEGKDPNAVLSRFGTIKVPREILRSILNKINQTIFIPDNKISWAKKALKKIDEILKTEHFDAIMVTAPPFSAFSVISEIKKKYHVPLFVDYRDLWYESYFAFYPTPFHKYLHKKMEYNALKAVDKVIVTNRKIKEKLLKNFPFLTHEDLVIISHGFDHEDFENIQAVPKPKNKMVLMYSGIFLGYNSPVYFLKAFKQLTLERPDIAKEIELQFVGFLRTENNKLITRLNLQEFVKDFGYVNHHDAVAKIKSADVLWLMVGHKRNIDAILPGKLYEYIGAEKPIIACVPDGAAKMAIEEYGAGFICDPDDILQIKNTIYKVFELWKKGELPKPDPELIKKYRRDYLSDMLAKQFQSKLKADVV